MRAYAGNHLSVDDEPVPCQDTLISPDDFLKLMRHTFPGEKEADVMACFKTFSCNDLREACFVLEVPQ